MNAEEVEKKVLAKIIPKKEEIEKTKKIAENIMEAIRKEGYEPVFVGSRARGTCIAGDRDIDIFVFFPETINLNELEKKGVELGKKILKKYKPETHYAQHPYVKAKVKGITVEIVPCYKVKNKIISAVDRTPLHNEYLKKKMTEEMKKQALLLKQFTKAQGIYGADQKTKGFSGYLCELLILHYGSFRKVLEGAAHSWNKRIIIDIEKKRKSYEKFKEPLVIIDPVDADRNVASALSITNLSIFILKARQYLEHPSIEFFFAKKKKVEIKKELKGRNIISVSFKTPKVIEEIVWSQLEKLTKTIKKELYEKEFEVLRCFHWTNEKKCVMLFELNTYELGGYSKHKGPEIWDEEHVKSFLKKNEKCWIQRSRIYSWKKRNTSTAEEVIKEVLEDESKVPSYLKDGAKKSKIRKGSKVKKEKEALIEYFSWV